MDGFVVPARMGPFALAAAHLRSASVSLSELLSGTRAHLHGETNVSLSDYTEEMLASGLPGLRLLSAGARRRQLDGYLTRTVDRDIADDAGVVIRTPVALHAPLMMRLILDRRRR